MKNLYKESLGIVEKFKKAVILHVGDLVLDQFLCGEISRISREAPVLILKYRETIDIPGGGANAINNLLCLGATVLPVGLLGNDEAGEKLAVFFRDNGVDTNGIMYSKQYNTPIKTRILAGSFYSSMQQMLRIDRENNSDASVCPENDLINKINSFLPKADGVVISDYGYGLIRGGVFEHLKTICRQRNIPVVVDSRFHLTYFHAVTSMTPNISEVETAFHTSIGEDLSQMDAIAKKIIHEQQLKALIITRGRLGMSLYQMRKKPIHLSVFGSDEVADVTGAGDTVVSVYTLALACGAPFEIAARLSNYAGGIVVMKRGTATVSDTELQSAIRADYLRNKLEMGRA